MIALLMMNVSPALAGDKAPTILHVASRELPSRFSPSGPLTAADRQAHDLLFEPLIAPVREADGSIGYRPGLVESFPGGQGTHLTFRVRSDAKWSNGEAVTANDVRHALGHLRHDAGAEFAWGMLLEPPQLGHSPREVRISLRHGLIDPWICFNAPMTPQIYRGRELNLRDDAEFAANPVGSGPFSPVVPTKDADRLYLVFRKNAFHPRAETIPFDEVHWFAAKDAKDLDRLKPDVTLDFDASATGSRIVQTTLTRRVWYVALNQRHPLLAAPELRRFLGLSLERDKIVGVKPRLSVTSLTPRDSWTNAPAPRVPDDLFQPEVASGLARQLAATKKPVELSFKFPADQSVHASQLIEQWRAAALAGGLELKIQPMPLSAAQLEQALAGHDFELVMTYEDHGDSIGRLLALFDQRPNALAPNGSNFLGVRDGELTQLVQSLPTTRRFPVLREQMHNLHVHLVQTMPVIPLWQHQAHYTLNPAFRVTSLDPLRPFADISAWRK
jgi:ABC-type oligopeptide transport system substrate-binding subunit